MSPQTISYNFASPNSQGFLDLLAGGQKDGGGCALRQGTCTRVNNTDTTDAYHNAPFTAQVNLAGSDLLSIPWILGPPVPGAVMMLAQSPYLFILGNTQGEYQGVPDPLILGGPLPSTNGIVYLGTETIDGENIVTAIFSSNTEDGEPGAGILYEITGPEVLAAAFVLAATDASGSAGTVTIGAGDSPSPGPDASQASVVVTGIAEPANTAWPTITLLVTPSLGSATVDNTNGVTGAGPASFLGGTTGEPGTSGTNGGDFFTDVDGTMWIWNAGGSSWNHIT
jgi:hypothetical protein